MNPYAQSMALGSAGAGAARLIAEARRFPMLEPQEEYMLAKRWREHGDTAAAHRLVTSHLRLVAKIALGYRGYGLPIADVISEGNVGLMHAVKRFDPDRGFRLTTYAIWWIRASIQEFILRSRSLVRIGTTANQKKLFFSLRRAKSKISALEEGDMRPDQVKLIANDLGVPEQEVIDMNRRLAGDASLNAPIRDDGDSGELQDWLVDEAASPERAMVESDELGLRRKALGEALGVLNHRERRIFEARRLAEDPITLEELADEFSVSRERVRQIETGAFEKVRHRVIHVLGAAQTKAPASRDTCYSPAVERGATGEGRRRPSILDAQRVHGPMHDGQDSADRRLEPASDEVAGWRFRLGFGAEAREPAPRDDQVANRAQRATLNAPIPEAFRLQMGLSPLAS